MSSRNASTYLPNFIVFKPGTKLGSSEYKISLLHSRRWGGLSSSKGGT